jgi:hypothetical protein
MYLSHSRYQPQHLALAVGCSWMGPAPPAKIYLDKNGNQNDQDAASAGLHHVAG